MDINKVTLIGNLMHAPKSHTMPSGQALTTFELATGEHGGNVEHHSLVATGRLAEIIVEYVKQGSKVYVEGRLRRRVWKDKAGKQREAVEVITDNLIMLGQRSGAALQHHTSSPNL